LLPHASELRKVLFLALSVTFCLCSMIYLGNRWTNLSQIHTEDVFGSSLGQAWMSRSKVKITRDKTAFFAPFDGLRVVYVS